MKANSTHFVTLLERFELDAWRCHPDFADRVRTHLRTKIGTNRRRAIVVVDEGTTEEVVIPLRDRLTLGRGAQNDLVLRKDTRISRYHARLWEEDGHWWFEDLDSANGTLVNGEMAVPRQPRRLFGGEELIVGNTFLRLRLD